MARHLIKKYANRKLYDTHTSRYITLAGISQLIRQGHEIQVVERDSGRDLTPLILSQTVASEEKRGPARAAAGAAAQVGERAGALLEYMRRTLNTPAAMVSGEVGRRRGDLEGMVDAAIDRALRRLRIPSRRDLDRLYRRLDDLTRRVERAGRPPAARARVAPRRPAARKPAARRPAASRAATATRSRTRRAAG